MESGGIAMEKNISIKFGFKEDEKEFSLVISQDHCGSFLVEDIQKLKDFEG